MKYRLYDIILHLSLIILLPYFIFKMFTARKYREGIAERFGFLAEDKAKRLANGPVIWFHAVSVGETKAVMPLVRLFKKKHPKAKIAFSTVTMTGNRVAKEEGKGLIDALFYFPLDLSWVGNRAVKKLRPAAFIVVEKEVWPNMIRRLVKNKVPVIAVNGTISDRSFKRFKAFGFFFREIFAAFGFFCGRTKEDTDRAVKLGVESARAATTGNMKFDLALSEIKAPGLTDLKKALGVDGKTKLIVAGSTHDGEEEVMLSAFKALGLEFNDIRLVIAPRHPERFASVERIITRSGFSCSRRTSSSPDPAKVVLLDTMGELMLAYSFADVAIVGGSFIDGIGGHNLLEPAVFEKPVVYGAYLSAYLGMAEMLNAAGGGFCVPDRHGALFEVLKRLISDESLRATAGDAAKAVVEANRGAVKKTLDIIEDFLPKGM
ncbi:3-deoxy-D-manno-octulosonic acid transferase [bacterium]|nr:MAG: 3-deoxy-D-manno-octulosonic acid transferase [bacterium]